MFVLLGPEGVRYTEIIVVCIIIIFGAECLF